MLLIDNQAGSIDLYPVLLSMPDKPDISLTRLEFGDVQFMGEGPDGQWLSVGIEYKRVNDVLSCIKDGRFAGHQLPGMRSLYDVLYLVVEGRYSQKRSDGGLFVAGRKNAKQHSGITYQALAGWLTSVEQSGVHLRQTDDREETAALLLALYGWWQKPWSEHKALWAVHAPAPPSSVAGISFLPHPTEKQEPTLVEWMAYKSADGVGWEKARAVAARFRTPRALLDATEAELLAVEGIGKKLAKAIVEGMSDERRAV